MLTRKKKRDLEHGMFQERWRYQYFFGETNGKPVCLICKQQFEGAQEYIVQRHYNEYHAEKWNNRSKEKSASIECSVNKHLLPKTAHKVSDAAVKASYMVAHTIALSQLGRPLSDRAFIKKCMLLTVRAICPDKHQDFADIDLSGNTMVRRICDLSVTLNGQLKDKVKNFVAFSVSIDEYAIGNEVSHLAVFIRGVDKNMEVTEEFVELIPVKERTPDWICNRMIKSLNGLDVDWAQVVSLARSGGPSLMSTGVATIFKEKMLALNPGNCFYDLHSVWHPEVFYTEILKMNSVIDGIEKIRVALKSRRLCLLAKHHPVVSYGYFKGGFLNRIHALCDELKPLFDESKCIPELEDVEWLQDLAFTVDIKEHINNLQAEVMGNKKLVMDWYDSMCDFEMKLQLFEKQLRENDLTHFALLKSRRFIDSSPCHAHNEKCSNKILELRKEFQRRLSSFKDLEKLFKVFWNPFAVSPYEAPEELQLELIELQCNLVLKNKFCSVDIGTFYKYLESSYPNLKSLAVKILSMFGSMRLYSKLFQSMNSSSSRYFFRLGDKLWKSGLKVATAQALSPDFDALVQVWRQRQAGVPLRNDEAGVSRAGADGGCDSVTDSVWSGQENICGKNQEIFGIEHLMYKEVKTEQSSNGEYLDGNESAVYSNVAEHPEDSRKRKHSMGDEKFPSVGDGRKYIKSEDEIDVKIAISKEYIFVEPYGEQDANIKQEPNDDQLIIDEQDDLNRV